MNFKHSDRIYELRINIRVTWQYDSKKLKGLKEWETTKISEIS